MFSRSIMTAFAVGCLFAGLPLGQAHGQEALPPGTFAIVNGVAQPRGILDAALAAAAKGGPVTPALRRSTQLELLARTVLSQEAVRQGLDKNEAVRSQVALFEQTMLAEAMIARHLTSQPVDDEAVRAEYERQKAQLKDAREYRLRHIVLADEAAAKAVIASLRRGEAFEKLAKEKSTEASGKNGGDLGWLLVEQIVPAVGNVVANLPKGGMSAVPIQTPAGWNVVKVDDIRPFTMPALETVSDRIRQSLIEKSKMELVRKLMADAKIRLNE